MNTGKQTKTQFAVAGGSARVLAGSIHPVGNGFEVIMSNESITWEETTEERYWEMLEVLPPAYMNNAGFLVGEPWDHHAINGQPRFQGYIGRHGRYLVGSRPMTIAEFKVAAEAILPARKEQAV